jgi:hypothetical protein
MEDAVVMSPLLSPWQNRTYLIDNIGLSRFIGGGVPYYTPYPYIEAELLNKYIHLSPFFWW